MAFSDLSLSSKSFSEGWRYDLVCRSTGYSSRDLELNSQEPQGGSQPYIVESNAHFWDKGIHADRALINLKIIICELPLKNQVITWIVSLHETIAKFMPAHYFIKFMKKTIIKMSLHLFYHNKDIHKHI